MDTFDKFITRMHGSYADSEYLKLALMWLANIENEAFEESFRLAYNKHGSGKRPNYKAPEPAVIFRELMLENDPTVTWLGNLERWCDGQMNLNDQYIRWLISYRRKQLNEKNK